MDGKKIKVGDKFEINFSGAGVQQGVKYEVYHITDWQGSVPVNDDDIIVYLKLVSRDGLTRGAKINDAVPAKFIEQFYKAITTRA